MSKNYAPDAWLCDADEGTRRRVEEWQERAHAGVRAWLGAVTSSFDYRSREMRFAAEAAYRLGSWIEVIGEDQYALDDDHAPYWEGDFSAEDLTSQFDYEATDIALTLGWRPETGPEVFENLSAVHSAGRMVLAGLGRTNPEQPNCVRRTVAERDDDRVAVDHLDHPRHRRGVVALCAEPPAADGRDHERGDDDRGA